MNTKPYLLSLAVALIGCRTTQPNAPSAVDYSSEIRTLREENTRLRSTIEAYDSRIEQLEQSSVAAVASYQKLISQLGGSPATIIAERQDRLASEARIARALLDLDEQLNTYVSRTSREQTRATIDHSLALDEFRTGIAALTSEVNARFGSQSAVIERNNDAVRADYQQKIDALERRVRGMEAHLPSGPAPSTAAQDAYDRATRGSAPPTPR